MFAFNLIVLSLEKLIKAAQVYQLPDFSAVGEAGVIKLVVRDKKNDTSNRATLLLLVKLMLEFNFQLQSGKHQDYSWCL